MSLLPRIGIIVLAFVLANAAAGTTITLALLGVETLSGPRADPMGFWTLVLVISGLTGAVSVAPLFLVVALAEGYQWRSVYLYAIAGVAIMVGGYFVSGFAERLDASAAHLPVFQEAQIAAAAGVVFGLVYWLFAGRKAGKWRSPRL